MFGGARTGRDNGSAGAVGFVDFGEKVKSGRAGLGNDEVGGSGG